MSVHDAVSRNLKLLRGRAGLTQERLAKKSRVHVKQISQIEGGSQNLTLDTLQRLADGLGVSVAELVNETEKAPSRPPKGQRAGLDAAIRLLVSYRDRIDE